MPETGFSPRRWYALAAIVVILDQVSKAAVLVLLHPGDVIVVAPFWNWVLTYNPGAAFSFLADHSGWQRWFFTALALAVSGWIISMLRAQPNFVRLNIALALILGGALGNVIDRVRFGAVVDFIQWHAAGYYWPAFNVADSAISVGAVLLILDQILVSRHAAAPSTSGPSR